MERVLPFLPFLALLPVLPKRNMRLVRLVRLARWLTLSSAFVALGSSRTPKRIKGFSSCLRAFVANL